jgi:hypothetical protein
MSSASAQGVQELRLGWDTLVAESAPSEASSAAPAPSALTLLGRRSASGSLPRQRNPELSSDQIVVVAEDAQGQALDWQLVADPRVLRSEGPGPTGELTGQVLQQPSTELMIAIPDDPAIVQLRLYHPRWTGTAFVLDLLGVIPLP